jgi:hypothetical protein
MRTMFAQCLWIVASAIYLLLGLAHLYHTFFRNSFEPRNPEVGAGMKNTHPRLTRRTTVWDAWIGFNASHSTGAIFLGLINIILALFHKDELQNSPSLLVPGVVTSMFYLWLGFRYWFRIPIAGILMATVAYSIATFLFLG